MCATFIGSTFSHSPLPGVRKSGMPDGTEIPAPVRPTARSAWPSRSARRPASVEVAEGADALLRVLGSEHRREALALDLEPLVELRLSRDLLDLLDGERRLLRQLARPLEGRVEQLVVGHDLVREPVAVRLVGVDRVADQVHLARLRLPDQPRQALGPAEAGDDPEVDLGLAERGRLGGDPEVARHRELTAPEIG